MALHPRPLPLSWRGGFDLSLLLAQHLATQRFVQQPEQFALGTLVTGTRLTDELDAHLKVPRPWGLVSHTRIFSPIDRSRVPPTIPAPTSLLAPLPEASLRWYRCCRTACDAVESPILRRGLLADDSSPLRLGGIACVSLPSCPQAMAEAQRYFPAFLYRYLQRHDLPHHPLRDQGYVSIGDVHSTNPLLPGLREEDNRFNGMKRECGLHD